MPHALVAPEELVVDDVIKLVRTTPDLADAWAESYSEFPEQYPHFGGCTQDEARDALLGYCDQAYDAHSRGFIASYALRLASVPDLFVGLSELRRTTPGTVQLGYEVAPPYQRKHIASRANRVLVDFALKDWGVRRIELSIAPDNTRSQLLATRLGANWRGHLIEEEGHTYQLWEIQKSA